MKLLFIVSFFLVVAHIGSASVLIPRRGWFFLPAKELRLRGGGYSDGEHLPNGPTTSPSKSDTTTGDERFNSTLLPHPKILEEAVIYNGWRKLVNRRVQLPTHTNDDDKNKKNIENSKQQRVVDFEIVSQGDHGGTVSDEAVMIFVWNRSTQTAVLLFEYMPSIHQFLNGLAAGMVEQKHAPPTDGTTTNEQDKNHNNHHRHTAPSGLVHEEDTSDSDAATVTAAAVETAARHELEEECRLCGGECSL